jgi:uncharacterized cupin superfamily protein
VIRRRLSEEPTIGSEDESMTEGVRRVVTGRNTAGRSVILSDERAPFVRDAEGKEWAGLWTLPAGPLDPESGGVPTAGTIGHECPPGAIAWRVARLAGSRPEAERNPARSELLRSDTLDWITVLSGPLDLVFDGASLRLESGDCVVQSGAPQAWRAGGEEPCLLGALTFGPEVGAEPASAPVGPRRSDSDRGVGPRRVVTRTGPDGRTVVVQDGEPPNVLRLEHGAGMAYSDIWQTFGPVGSPDAGGDTPAGPFEFYAVGGGAAWKHMVIPPDAALAEIDAEKLGAEYAERAPGMASGGEHDPARPGRHRTDSIDLVQILSGQITLMLDEGEVDRHPGDFVVQRGTWHAWSNRGNEPCVFQAMMISTGPLPA